MGQLIQICTVTPSLRDAVDDYLKLGVGPFALYHFDTSTNTKAWVDGRPVEFKYDVATTTDHMWEVSQPIAGVSMFSEFLSKNGGRSGYQHIAIRPPDGYDAAIKEFDRRGFDLVMKMTHWEKVHVSYFSNGGSVIEVFMKEPGFTMPPPDGWMGITSTKGSGTVRLFE